MKSYQVRSYIPEKKQEGRRHSKGKAEEQQAVYQNRREFTAALTRACSGGAARWYQHQEVEPLREIINQRNQRRKFGQVFGQVLENEPNEENDPIIDICLTEIGLRWWTRKESNLQPVD